MRGAKYPRCPSVSERINKLWDIYTGNTSDIKTIDNTN